MNNFDEFDSEFRKVRRYMGAWLVFCAVLSIGALAGLIFLGVKAIEAFS